LAVGAYTRPPATTTPENTDVEPVYVQKGAVLLSAVVVVVPLLQRPPRNMGHSSPDLSLLPVLFALRMVPWIAGVLGVPISHPAAGARQKKNITNPVITTRFLIITCMFFALYSVYAISACMYSAN
jgi:hypothetical protein